MIQLARLVSILFNPLLVLIAVPYIMVFKESQNGIYSFKWTIFSSLFLLFIALFVLYGKRRGFFSDFGVSKREERAKLFMFAGFITFLYLLSLMFLNAPRILFIAILSVLMGVLSVSLVNMKIKASVHVATISAFSLSLILFYGKAFFLSLLLIPIVSCSRIILKKHTLKEVLMGGALGSLLTIVIYFIVKYHLLIW